MATNLRLRTARVAKGFTQRQLAEHVGVKEIDISRYETRRAQPKHETKQRIALVLQKPAFEIFDNGGALP